MLEKIKKDFGSEYCRELKDGSYQLLKDFEINKTSFKIEITNEMISIFCAFDVECLAPATSEQYQCLAHFTRLEDNIKDTNNSIEKLQDKLDNLNSLKEVDEVKEVNEVDEKIPDFELIIDTGNDEALFDYNRAVSDMQSAILVYVLKYHNKDYDIVCTAFNNHLNILKKQTVNEFYYAGFDCKDLYMQPEMQQFIKEIERFSVTLKFSDKVKHCSLAYIRGLSDIVTKLNLKDIRVLANESVQNELCSYITNYNNTEK